MGEAKRRKDIEKRRINIEPGYALCKLCDGYGYKAVVDKEGYFETYQGKTLVTKCFRCKGEGQVTWLQNIFSNG